jgi:hypothetical protein
MQWALSLSGVCTVVLASRRIGMVLRTSFRRRAVIALAIGAVVLVGCVLLNMAALEIEDGSREIRLRLKLTGIPDGPPPRVVWSEQDTSRRWVDTLWAREEFGGHGTQFKSTAPVNFSIHRRAFTHDEGWWFRPENRLIVVVVGEKRFRFEPASLFGPGGSGHSPPEVAATFDASEYLSGQKTPAPLDFAPDVTRSEEVDGSR